MRQRNAFAFIVFYNNLVQAGFGKITVLFQDPEDQYSIHLVLEGKFTQNCFMMKMPNADAFVWSVTLKGLCNLDSKLKTYGHCIKQRQHMYLSMMKC